MQQNRATALAMTVSNSVRRLFGVPDDEPNVLVAQARALSRQVPILHTILSLDAMGVAYTHYGVAPDGLTILPLAVLLAACAGRVLVWSRTHHHAIGPEEALRRLRGTNRLAAILGSGFAIWAILLTRYGDAATNLHVLYFLSITMIACISCLTHLRTAALIVSALAVPVSAYFLVIGAPVVRAAALNYVGVVVVMLFMQSVYYRDFRRLTRLTEENHALAHTDPLTGLPNRRSFFAELEQAIAAAGTAETRFAIGLIDLDGFKPVNDTLGHQAGDAVLREVGRRLRDTLGEAGVVARLGGDEFGLILPGSPDLDALGRTLCAVLKQPFALRDAAPRIGATIGFARFPETAAAAELLIERADHALYHAKAHAPGTATCFAFEHENRMHRQAQVEQALRRADLASEFHLLFQPIVDVVAGRVQAYEALARWDSPTLGRVSPADFIAVAERTGLIHDLSLVLLGKALAAMASWPEEVALSFNLSAHDLAAAEGIATITALIAASGIAPARIVFEVTETGLMRDLVDAGRALGALRALGVGIALDDFGTGYSSLGYVHRLPISELKIDRSFVTDICSDAASRNIIHSILDLAHNLRLLCVVEGVETDAQMLHLRAAGCRYMQGYLFHRPMPAAAIAAFEAGLALPQPQGEDRIAAAA